MSIACTSVTCLCLLRLLLRVLGLRCLVVLNHSFSLSVYGNIIATIYDVGAASHVLCGQHCHARWRWASASLPLHRPWLPCSRVPVQYTGSWAVLLPIILVVQKNLQLPVALADQSSLLISSQCRCRSTTVRCFLDPWWAGPWP